MKLSSAAFLLPVSMAYANQHRAAVARSGVKGNKFTLGTALFRQILSSPQGTVISDHRQEDMWSFVATPDRLIHLAVPELLDQLKQLKPADHVDPAYPLVLMAGERRSYNANQIYRDPTWRKQDPHGALRIHPSDAHTYALTDGGKAICQSHGGALEVVVELDDTTRPGFVTLPHGYGMRYQDGEPIGPQLNRLTSSGHCDPLTRTPHHKFVPVSLRPVAA